MQGSGNTEQNRLHQTGVSERAEAILIYQSLHVVLSYIHMNIGIIYLAKQVRI